MRIQIKENVEKASASSEKRAIPSLETLLETCGFTYGD
jgi:hypothetical protein